MNRFLGVRLQRAALGTAIALLPPALLCRAAGIQTKKDRRIPSWFLTIVILIVELGKYGPMQIITQAKAFMMPVIL